MADADLNQKKRITHHTHKEGGIPNGQIITEADFTFEQYSDPVKFFRSPHRPLRLITDEPLIRSYSNALYTPCVPENGPHYGCLFDRERNRIGASCLFRGPDDDCMSKEPLKYRGTTADLTVYDYPVIYLGFFSDHHGHFLIETLAKWWVLAVHYLEVARYLIHVPDARMLDLPAVQACLALAGIAREQLVHFKRPVLLKKVIVPETSFQIRSHIHLAYRKMWAALLARLNMGKANNDNRPLYVSRSRLERGIVKYLGEERIEAYFRQKGARIIHPQRLPFKEQVRLFNKHSRIIGLGGSGMHNIVFSKSPKDVVYLSAKKINANFFLIDRCFNMKSTYLQACQMRYGVATRLIRRLLREKRRRINAESGRWKGFLRVRRLDHSRVIEWFEESGYV